MDLGGLNADRQKGADRNPHCVTHKNRKKLHGENLFRKHFHFLPSVHI